MYHTNTLAFSPTNMLGSNLLGSGSVRISFDGAGRATFDASTNTGYLSVSNLIYSAPVWDDVRIPMSSLRSGVTPPTAKEFIGGIRAWAFDKAVDDMLEGELQVPHGVNTNWYIALHLHYAVTNNATTTNGVIWGIEHTVANPNRVFISPAITTTITNFPGTNLLHKVVPIVNVSNCTDSAVIMVRLFRDANATGDTHDDDAYALSLDAHFVRIRPGSVNEGGDH